MSAAGHVTNALREVAAAVCDLRARGRDDEAAALTHHHDALALWAARTLSGPSEALEPIGPAPVVDLDAERRRRRRGPPGGDAG